MREIIEEERDNRDNRVAKKDFKLGFTVQNNTVYTGHFDLKTNCKEGFGVQVWPDGSKYVGLWKEGKAFGYGRFILSDGDAY